MEKYGILTRAKWRTLVIILHDFLSDKRKTHEKLITVIQWFPSSSFDWKHCESKYFRYDARVNIRHSHPSLGSIVSYGAILFTLDFD